MPFSYQNALLCSAAIGFVFLGHIAATRGHRGISAYASVSDSVTQDTLSEPQTFVNTAIVNKILIAAVSRGRFFFVENITFL
ncbi:hypothetical protein L3X38_022584 [Prunus dulcis]|uniref:Uncharacterized protein n=1 Tax=Prunus dulcis TaxID=3755 RepID=A0AAD4Z4G1_PRUDU|nr:hypothetical protein L3X38_022584 [Prunus dulcis]